MVRSFLQKVPVYQITQFEFNRLCDGVVHTIQSTVHAEMDRVRNVNIKLLCIYIANYMICMYYSVYTMYHGETTWVLPYYDTYTIILHVYLCR